jgi:hypothetical protein
MSTSIASEAILKLFFCQTQDQLLLNEFLIIWNEGKAYE